MTAPPPGRLVTVHTRLASITGTVVSVRRGIVNVAGQLIPAPSDHPMDTSHTRNVVSTEVQGARSMTTRVHPDEDPLDVAHVVGLERTDVPAGFTARALSDDQPVWVDYAEDDLVAFLNTRLDRDGMVIIEITRP